MAGGPRTVPCFALSAMQIRIKAGIYYASESVCTSTYFNELERISAKYDMCSANIHHQYFIIVVVGIRKLYSTQLNCKNILLVMWSLQAKLSSVAQYTKHKCAS